MNINFYFNTSAKNAIGKSLTNELALTGTLRDECSIVNPEFMVEAEDLSSYNYCYIPKFNRYYFVNNIISVRNNLWRVILHVDVLDSFKSDILNKSVILDKQQNINKSNLDFDDGSFVVESGEFIETKMYPSGFNSNGEFILITAGAI